MAISVMRGSRGLISPQCSRTCPPYSGHSTASTITQRRNTSRNGEMCPTARRLASALPAQNIAVSVSSTLGH